MEPLYIQQFTLNDMAVDRYGFLKSSAILFFAQEAAGQHCLSLRLDADTLAKAGLFWAVIRHRVQVTRLPRRGETIRVETWPMPTTRAAYPRSVVAYDENGQECFRSISLWVLMDLDSRKMILPGKSGIAVSGVCRGTELAAPAALPLARVTRSHTRRVCYTDLDRNGHVNNTRYLDWVADLLPSGFHLGHRLRELTVCYYSEGREGEQLRLCWEDPREGQLQVDAFREDSQDRVFSLRLLFDTQDGVL